MNNNVMRVIVLMILSLFIISCSKSFDKDVAQYIEDNCKDFNDPYGCVIDLSKVTKFEWDNVYVFNSMTMPEEISEAIGFDCECNHVKDNYSRILFTKGDRIVYQSQYYGLDAKVQFRNLNKGDVYVNYTREKSKFYSLKKANTLSAGYFFDMYPIGGYKTPTY